MITISRAQRGSMGEQQRMVLQVKFPFGSILMDTHSPPAGWLLPQLAKLKEAGLCQYHSEVTRLRRRPSHATPSALMLFSEAAILFCVKLRLGLASKAPLLAQ